MLAEHVYWSLGSDGHLLHIRRQRKDDFRCLFYRERLVSRRVLARRVAFTGFTVEAGVGNSLMELVQESEPSARQTAFYSW